ncbi:MAG TPA: diphthine synthase [Candidatus Diapherotrites archaeon]|uniref:Diphthine synthase n=1 Tax=Candidatus Iainarchaeum sp. TaxID=3101447 RepID=A0A7J4IWF3_9ARCH|nr:diphthine synthase [Candidatus Diapherotrites archaeon]
MLCLVGIGLYPGQLTLEALSALRECEKIYLENYTSSYSQGSIDKLKELTGKEVATLARRQVEEELTPVIEEARTKKIALAVFGSPLNATTHVQILLDAKKMGVQTKAIAGISIFEYVAFTGLDRYKFGRTTTIVFHGENYEPESFYDTIAQNKKAGLHTLCLLDIQAENEKMMDVRHAISLLEMIEEKREESAISESICIGIAGAGSDGSQIKAGTLEQLKKFNFSIYPQSLIVCGKINEKEGEALRALSDLQ